MNNVSLSSKVIYWNPKDFAVSQNFNKVIRENEKVSNIYHWKSNKAEGVDCFGRALDLTTLINKPDGYLQGRLSDVDDADYYQFNIAEYRILGTVSDKHNLDITVTLDHIPEGCDYDLVLYDGDGNQVGIGQDNGSGGKSVTVPNWNLENREYTVKVLAKDGSPVNAEEYYHLSFQTKPENQTYLDYRADILTIKNYEKMNGNSLLGGFSAKYTVDGETIRTVSV